MLLNWYDWLRCIRMILNKLIQYFSFFLPLFTRLNSVEFTELYFIRDGFIFRLKSKFRAIFGKKRIFSLNGIRFIRCITYRKRNIDKIFVSFGEKLHSSFNQVVRIYTILAFKSQSIWKHPLQQRNIKEQLVPNILPMNLQFRTKMLQMWNCHTVEIGLVKSTAFCNRQYITIVDSNCWLHAINYQLHSINGLVSVRNTVFVCRILALLDSALGLFPNSFSNHLHFILSQRDSCNKTFYTFSNDIQFCRCTYENGIFPGKKIVWFINAFTESLQAESNLSTSCFWM